LLIKIIILPLQCKHKRNTNAIQHQMSEDNNKIFRKQMSYERRRSNGKDNGGHLEGACGGDRGGVDGERGAGGCGEGGVRVVAPGDAGDSVHLGGMPRLDPKISGRRKAFEAAMAWLFNPESNPDAWMLKDMVVKHSAKRGIN
jgi:hypothetical protein